jgi:hypothetical protein
MAMRLLRTEIETVMAQIGCPNLRELGPGFLYPSEAGRNRPG